MADDHGAVKIRVSLPRAAAEYAVRVLADGNPGRPIDPAQPVDLVGPNGSHGADWPMFARFAEAAMMGVIIEEWHKREHPNGPTPHDAPSPPDWVTGFKRLQLVFYDEVP